MDEFIRTMSFKMGKQALNPSSMPTSTSKYFHMWSRERTILLWIKLSPPWIIVQPHITSCKEFFSKEKLKLHLEGATLEHFLACYMVLHHPLFVTLKSYVQ
jgi:hypothetical protein